MHDRYYWPGMRRDVKAYIAGVRSVPKEKGQQKQKWHQSKLFAVATQWRE